MGAHYAEFWITVHKITVLLSHALVAEYVYQLFCYLPITGIANSKFCCSDLFQIRTPPEPIILFAIEAITHVEIA